MEKKIARKIIDEHNLIYGNASRDILKALIKNQPVNKTMLPDGVTSEQIEKIRLSYLNKVQEMGSAEVPRNLLFYHMVKEKFPDVSWEITTNKDLNTLLNNVIIKAPRVNGLRPSLLSLLLDRVDVQKDTNLHRKYSCVEELPASIVEKISALMETIDVIFPTEREMQGIVNWFLKGLNGEEVTIFSPICPDYSVEETGNKEYPFRHTFNHVGNGIGLIAQRILNAFPLVEAVLKKCGIKVNFIVGLGDFETLAESNLKRVKITKEEFVNRCKKSKIAFQNACLFPTEVYMITDMCGGYQTWLDMFEHFREKLRNNEYGASELSPKKMFDIIEKRKNLYNRWYGKKDFLVDYLPYIINQGAEYAALGEILAKLKSHCLVLGADNDAMAPFYSIKQAIPTLYLKRYYC